MRWRLFLEEYSPDIKWLKGASNLVADALSRLDFQHSPMEEAHFTQELRAFHYAYSQEEEKELCCPLQYTLLQQHQRNDSELVQALTTGKYKLQAFHRGADQLDLICHKGKIVVPVSLQGRIMEWYHLFLIHPGINRTEETIAQHLWWKTMRQDITKHVVTCPICQRNKRQQKKYGKLPPKVAEAKPWERLCVDLIGPYKIRCKDNSMLKCQCVTMVDPATGWFEVHEYGDKRAITVANIVEQQWLTRYPRPDLITYDKGPEFMGVEFRNMVEQEYSIKTKPITTRNPQANAIIERVHQVIGNMIRTMSVNKDYLDADDPWARILASCMFAIQATIHTTLQASPMQLVFGCDAMLNIPFEANWNYIKNVKQHIIEK